jgi:hypothetical protein
MFAKDSNHKASAETPGGRKISPQILPEQLIFAVTRGLERVPASRARPKIACLEIIFTVFGKLFLRPGGASIISRFAIAGAIAPAPEAKQSKTKCPNGG